MTNNTNNDGPLVLIAEDDPEIRVALERILGYEGYRTITANDGAAALEAVSTHAPDGVVLDVMMPFVDGITVCRRMREKGDRTPILMLTARHELSDRVGGLDAGADDYLAKPFELDELLARLRAILRRTIDPTETPLSVGLPGGQLTLDPQRHLVLRNGHAVDLTRTEFEILHLLMRNVDIVLERSVIYDRIWGYDFESSSRSLDVHVGYLRRKLEEGGHNRLIDTVRGIGFVIRSKGAS